MRAGAHDALNEEQERWRYITSTLRMMAEYDPDLVKRYRRAMLAKVMDDALRISEAPMGNIQLFDSGSNALRIEVEHGFRDPFLQFFDCVHCGESACGTALKNRGPVMVQDVERSALFRNTDALEVLREAEVRAVLSIPLIGSSGSVLGVISTHWRDQSPNHGLGLVPLKRLADCTARWIEERGFTFVQSRVL